MAKENKEQPKQDGSESSDAVETPKTGVFARLKALTAQSARDEAIDQLEENEALNAENEALIERNEALAADLSDAKAALETATARVSELEQREADLLKQVEAAKASAGKQAADIAARSHVDVEKLPGSDNSGDGETPYEKKLAEFKAAANGSYEKARLAKEVKELAPA